MTTLGAVCRCTSWLPTLTCSWAIGTDADLCVLCSVDSLTGGAVDFAGLHDCAVSPGVYDTAYFGQDRFDVPAGAQEWIQALRAKFPAEGAAITGAPRCAAGCGVRCAVLWCDGLLAVVWCDGLLFVMRCAGM